MRKAALGYAKRLLCEIVLLCEAIDVYVRVGICAGVCMGRYMQGSMYRSVCIDVDMLQP